MKKELNKPEKRRISRIKAKIPVICRVVDSDTDKGQEIKTTSENISKKGVLLIWPKHIPDFERTLNHLKEGKERRKSFAPRKKGQRERFSRVEIELRQKDQKIKTFAKICWGRKKRASHHKYELGLCFLNKENLRKTKSVPFSNNFYWELFKKSGSLPAYLNYMGRKI